MADVVPRLVLCLKFLNAHPEIRTVGPEVGGRLGELLEIIGLSKSRLIVGVVRAKTVLNRERPAVDLPIYRRVRCCLKFSTLQRLHPTDFSCSTKTKININSSDKIAKIH